MASLEQEDKEQEIFFDFINSLRSPVTKQIYKTNIRYYLVFCHLTELSQLLVIQEPDKQIIKYITALREKGLSTNSINTRLSAIYHFYTMQDVILNKKKINMFIGEPTLKQQDKPYTHEQIQKILNICDLRWKCIIGLLCSSGCRIGSIAQLRLRNLEKIESCYKIIFYAGTNDEYYSFCSPECVTFIDTYLGYRSTNGEKLDQDSYLIRNQFDINDLDQIRNKSKGIGTGTIKVALNLLLRKAGIRHLDKVNPHKRKETAMSHGLIKYWTKQLIDSGVELIHIELLRGHDIGLTGKYYRPTEQDMFSQYKKAIDNLTIDPNNRLKKQVQTLQIEVSRIDKLEQNLQKLQQKYEKSRISLNC